MCGIVGTAAINRIVDQGTLIAQRDTMVHRGPDGQGVWWSTDGRVGLGHRRLAIIDLSPTGHQPMSDTSARLHITFNGEIYNFSELRKELQGRGHTFRSQTDTEVILVAYLEWGTDCLTRLNGMFAFGLYDSAMQTLFLARDRAGEKPLFYWYRNGALTFASELKAVMADRDLERRLDPVSLNHYLAFGYVPGERCIVKGVNKLPPAHAALFDVSTGAFSTWRYWQVPALRTVAAGHAGIDDEELVDELQALLNDSVRRQLVADVPVGILLSGGVDSSLITAIAARDNRKVRTFTVGFPGQKAYDETPHARLVADRFGTNHLEIPANAVSFDLLSTLAVQFDEPIVDSSMIPTYLVCKLVRPLCTVALGGDGGDEVFGGYDHYGRLIRMQNSLGWVPQPVRAAAAGLAERLLPVGMRGRSFMAGIGTDFRGRLAMAPRLFDRIARRRVLSDDVTGNMDDAGHPEPHWPENMSPDADILDRALRADFQYYLAEDILVKVDRVAMLNSLETRAPFLDFRIIEFAFSRVPSRLKADHCRKKILAKMLGKRLLPPSFDWERKQGFSIPLAQWLRKQWQVDFRSLLFDGTCDFFDRAELERLWGNHQKGFANSERLFAIGMLQLWRHEYEVSW
jgi:asparagine synthase (glutamine-hydrolysing)